MHRGFLLLIVVLALLDGCSRSEEERHTPLMNTGGDANAVPQEPYYYGLIEECRHGLAEDPHNRAATVALANAYYDSGDWKAAAEYYERALKLDPHDTDILTDLGTCYRNLGMPDRAITYYQRALQYHPNHVNTLYNLGIVYAYDKKDYVHAVHHWEALLRVAPAFHHAAAVRESVAKFKKKQRGTR